MCDTGDLRSIERFRPRDATTNPSLITAAAQMPEYADVVDGALAWAAKQAGGDEARTLDLAVDRLSVELGLRILAIVPGGSRPRSTRGCRSTPRARSRTPAS